MSDRTDEFRKSMEKFATNPARMLSRNGHIQNGYHKSGSVSGQQYQKYSSFMRGSRAVARDLAKTYARLDELNSLARKRTLFDGEESSRRLNELVYEIKQDIQSLNQQIGMLRKHQDQHQAQSAKANIESHSQNVLLNLQQTLAKMSSKFKSTLELRSANLQQQRARREQFTSPTPAMPPPSSTSSSFYGRSSGMVHSSSSSNLVNRKPASVMVDLDGASQPLLNGDDHHGGQHHRSHSQDQTQLLMYDDGQQGYLEERATAMQSIESTIVELGTIFNQLATMVQQQEEMITRIDHNVQDTQLNVEAAHEQLLRYFQTISNNRWLMLKIFGVLFFFFMFFIIFAA